LYGGGNYLKTELTVTGQVSTPGDELVIDYTIQQENKDRWNLVTGANWDINKRWSLAAEYNGFIGSREAVIVSVGTRF
jgi:opacity protein-like surface antigen